MKFNKWTMGLAAIGVVSLASVARADETKMSQVETALSNTTLSGYVDTSAQWNIGSQNGGATPGSIGLYGYGAGKADGFNLNAIDLALDKPLDESPWAAGYHVELMFGPDSPASSTGEAYGDNTGTRNNTGYNSYFSVPNYIRQAYVTLRTPVADTGIDWKIGVWDTIIGYESSSDPLNPNYTRSYGYTVEPTTHTGILATYRANDMVSVSAGIADGSQVNVVQFGTVGPAPINGRAALESQKAYMAAVALTAPDSWGWMKGATINAGIIDAIDSGRGTFQGTTSFYAGATVPTPMTALKVGAAFDYLDLHNAHHGGGNSDSSLWNVGLYANFQANDKLSFNGRAEHLDVNGSKIAADEFTATVQYALWANVLTRAEIRWDHVEHGTAFDNAANAGNGAGQNPNGFGIHDNAFLVALNVIYQF